MAGEALSPRGNRCERARQWASLRLDDELSELEEVLLEKHLEGCAACRTFEARMQRTTELVRLTPADVPRIDYAPPPRRVISFPAGRRAAIAAIAAAAALGSLVGSSLQRPAPSPSSENVAQISFLTRDLNQLRQLPRQQAPKPAPVPIRTPGQPPEGVI